MDLTSLMGKKEDLHPDLVPYLRHMEIGQVLYHPTVLQAPYIEALNAVINHAYAAKTAQLKRAKEDRDFFRYVFLHERPFRLEALLELAHNPKIGIPYADYSRLVASVWVDSENPGAARRHWLKLFGSLRYSLNHAMDEADTALFRKLPERFIVYRGVPHKERGSGLSWTLSQTKAKWFANRWNSRTPTVYSGEVLRHNVALYTNARNEEEIVVTARPLNLRLL